ncbi:MAG: glycine betaine ABC transporter substrate-binding protein [Pseudonocardiaceae bacterium]
MKRTVALLAVATLTAILSACGSSNPLAGDGSGERDDGTVVIGSADFAESELIMEIYAQALRAAGIEVRTQPRLGSREVTNRALQDGSLGVMPEYSGNLLQSVDPAATTTATTSDEVYTVLRQALPEGLEVLEQSEAQNRDVLVVTRQTSERFELTSMDQLGPRCGQFVLGAAGEWPGRWQDRIAELYGCTFQQIIATDVGGPVTLESLRSGQAQVVNLFTTSPDIRANNWVELDDPKQMYPAQNILPLMRAGVLQQAGVDALNEVSAALTTETLVDYNRRITEERAVPADLAKEFVAELR